MSRIALLAAAALVCIAASGRGAQPADTPATRQLALVVRLDAVAGQTPVHVADLGATAGLVVGLVGAPTVEGTQCTLRFVITNLTDRVAYNPRIRIERRDAQRSEPLVMVSMIEGSAGLSAVSISNEVVAIVELASLGTSPGELLAVPEAAPWVIGSVGSHTAGAQRFSIAEYARSLRATPRDETTVVATLGPGCIHEQTYRHPGVGPVVVRCYRDLVHNCATLLTFQRNDYGMEGDLTGAEFRRARACARSCGAIVDAGAPQIAGIRLGQRARKALAALGTPLETRTLAEDGRQVLVHEFPLGPEEDLTFLTVGVQGGRVVAVGFHVSE